MTKYCKNCGAEIPEGSNFCKKCGTQTTTSPQNKNDGILNKFKSFSTAKKLIIIVLLLIILFIIIGALSSPSTTTEPTLSLTNLAITSTGYGGYDVSGDLVASQDYDYLEIVTVYYDDQGTILQQDPLTWNMNDVKANQNIKVSGTAYVDSGTPTRAEIYVFDSPFSGGDLSTAIYSQNVTL